MAMNEQKNVLHKEFMKHFLRHGGSYTDVFEIDKLVHIAERIMGIYLHHTNYNMSH